MDDTATYGSPGNGASPNSNPILAQPPLQPDPSAGDGEGTRALRSVPEPPPFMLLMGHLDVQMSEGLATDSNIKQDSTTPAPGRTN